MVKLRHSPLYFISREFQVVSLHMQKIRIMQNFGGCICGAYKLSKNFAYPAYNPHFAVAYTKVPNDVTENCLHMKKPTYSKIKEQYEKIG